MFRYTNHVEDIYYMKARSNDGSINHKGDSRTGGGGKDDEQIFIDLEKITKKINSLMFVVTVFSPEGDFSKISNSFVRLVDVTKGTLRQRQKTSFKNVQSSSNELCRFTLVNCGNRTALIMCKMYRYSPSTWKLLMIGEPSFGQIYKHLIPKVAPFLTNPPPLRIINVTVHQATGLSSDASGIKSYCILKYDMEKATSKTIDKTNDPACNQTFSLSGQADHGEIDVYRSEKFGRTKFLGRVVFDVLQDSKQRTYSLVSRGNSKDKLAAAGKLQLSVELDRRVVSST